MLRENDAKETATIILMMMADENDADNYSAFLKNVQREMPSVTMTGAGMLWNHARYTMGMPAITPFDPTHQRFAKD